MADEVTTPEVAASPAPAVIDTPEQLAASQAAKLAKHVKLAQRANAESGDAPAAEPAGDEPPLERGKDGKFLPRGEKAAAKEAEPKPPLAKTQGEPAKVAPAKAEQTGDASVARARQLMDSGKVDDAIKLVFGKAPSELLTGKTWEAWRHQNEKKTREITQAADLVNTQRQQVQQAAQQLMPLVHARQAIEAGNFEQAVKLAFGMDFNDFQKRALHSFHGQNPDTIAARNEARAAMQALEQYKQQVTQLTEQQKVDATRASIKSAIAEAVATSDVAARFAKSAKFHDRVFAVEAKHYDARTDSTLPRQAAIEEAFDQMVAEYRDEYGEDPPWANAASPAAVTSVRSAQSSATGPGRNPVRQAKATNLRQSEAAEAGAPVKLRGQALLDAYVAKAKAELSASG